MYTVVYIVNLCCRCRDECQPVEKICLFGLTGITTIKLENILLLLFFFFSNVKKQKIFLLNELSLALNWNYKKNIYRYVNELKRTTNIFEKI